MSSTRQQPQMNLLSIEPVSANPHLQATEGIRNGAETCSITVHSNYNSRTNLQPFSNSFTSLNIPNSGTNLMTFSRSCTSLNIPFTNGECNSTAELRDPLEVLNIITEICLIIGAVIAVISMGIVFFIVGLAIMRMPFIKGYYEENVIRRVMLNVNELN